MNKELLDILLELDIEQIEEVKKRLRERYSDDKQLIVKCQMAIEMKRDQKKREDIIAIINEVKNESAPSGATNTEQGNETRQPATENPARSL